ncbi:MAG: hypothetical protein M5R41_06220 [Bacteroidia bacterium]|nr:hypothetical protein [Bacteroidia bacterium]
MKPFLFLAIILFLAGTVVAQKTATFTLQDGEEITAVIVSVSDDSIVFTQPHLVHYAERTEALPRHALAREQIRTITYDGGVSVLSTTLIGAGAGLITSGILAATMDDDEGFLSKVFVPVFRAFFIIVGTAGGAIGGLLYGLLAPDSGTSFDLSKDADYEILKAAHTPDANGYDNNATPSQTPERF